jgi:Uma2 family endonuclease
MENMVQEPAPKYNYVSPDEYLVFERASEEKNEYYDGYIIAKSGASLVHNMIERNLLRRIGNFLDSKECQILPSDMRVTNPGRENYLYPDASIVCGKLELEDEKFDTLANPSIIFEILSSSTKGADKRRKLFFYMQIPSMKEYIMIDSLKRHIIISRRQADNSWKFEELHEDAMSLYVVTINFQFPVAELYEGTGL